MFRNLVCTLAIPLILTMGTLLVGAESLRAATARPSPLQLEKENEPSVTGITRDAGPRRGGAVVTITGRDLSGATVTIDGIKAFVVSTSTRKIVIVTPPGRRGQRKLIVRTPSGGRATTNYTYL